jgi:hypothetical protein
VSHGTVRGKSEGHHELPEVLENVKVMIQDLASGCCIGFFQDQQGSVIPYRFIIHGLRGRTQQKDEREDPDEIAHDYSFFMTPF